MAGWSTQATPNHQILSGYGLVYLLLPPLCRENVLLNSVP
ncbi:hypothetical protein [Desulfofustis phage LS06-2018-MD01]|nr:hypothetical protein [Desulfofustis phage LS06-2018-MD01]